MTPGIYIGPAGWLYKDWQGYVYPPHPPKGFSPLRYLADFVNLVEVNSSFYRLPKVEAVQGWLNEVRHKPGFMFCVKLLQRFTHTAAPYTPADVAAFAERLAVLHDAERLAALLIQFPWSFKYSQQNAVYVLKLAGDFRPFPIAVEFRHNSWLTESMLSRLHDYNIALVNIDTPEYAHSLPHTSLLTADFAYLRLHGRNAAQWFTDNDDSAQRYNYLYNQHELEEILANIRKIRDKTGNFFIVFNNHFRGQAMVNVLETMAHLDEQPLLPGHLVTRYPELRNIGRSATDEQLSFF